MSSQIAVRSSRSTLASLALVLVLLAATIALAISTDPYTLTPPPPTTPALPAEPPPVHAVESAPAPPPPPPTVAEAMAKRAHVCFAVSKNHRRAACALGRWSIQTGSTLEIAIVGELGDAQSTWTYHEIEGMQFEGGDPVQPSAPAELAAARHALTERGYEVSDEPRIAIANHAKVTVGTWTFRRERITTHQVVPWKPGDPPSGGDWNEYEEHLEIQCGRRWVPVPIDDVRYDEPAIWISQLNPQTALIELDADWGIEGEHGGTRAALALDVAQACLQ